MDDSLSGPGERVPRRRQHMDDSLSGSGERVQLPRRRQDKMDDSLSAMGDRQPIRRQFSSDDDLDKSEKFANLVKKDAPRRSLSAELDSSLVIGDKNWKGMDTVHKSNFNAFDDSESLMEDSFAGSSFCGSQDSFALDDNEAATSQFTQLDDEPPSKPPGEIPIPKLGRPSPRRNTPRRTYSQQRKQMPKKSAPMSAICETDNDSVSIEES